MATVIAEVRTTRPAGFQRRRLGLFEASFRDGSRSILLGKWFHGEYLSRVLEPGKKLALFGKVEIDTYTGDLTMLHPEIEILDSEDDAERRFTSAASCRSTKRPGKITTRIFRTLVNRVLQSTLADSPIPFLNTSAADWPSGSLAGHSGTCISRRLVRTSAH